jgi:ABC-type glycerol-3-phosphate transport system substrate-binding protein
VIVRRTVTAVFGLALVAALTACSGGSGDSSASATPTTTTEAAGTARIDAFEAPDMVQCGTATSTNITVTYTTSGAAKQVLLVDGREVPLDAPSGSAQAALHCDALPHTVVLYLTDSDGHHSSEKKIVMTSQG